MILCKTLDRMPFEIVLSICLSSLLFGARTTLDILVVCEAQNFDFSGFPGPSAPIIRSTSGPRDFVI